MLTFGYILVVLFVLGFFLVLHRTFWVSYYKVDAVPDESHNIITDDGWRLAIHRYRSRGKLASQPIITCHGLGTNGHNFELGKDQGFLRQLQKQGWDVWNLELRGVGMSERPRFFSKNKGWTFDDHYLYDLPCAIDHVLKCTGQKQLHWIGHSMGGLAMYCYLLTKGDRKIRSVVTLGTPGQFMLGSVYRILRLLLPLTRILPSLRLSFLAQVFAPFAVALRANLIGINGANMDTVTLRKCLVNVISDIHSGLLRQFGRWMEQGHISSLDGHLNLTESLGAIKVPCLLIAGGRDELVSPVNVRFVFDEISSELKNYIVASREYGFEEDYGHGDLLLGKNVDQEMYPIINGWLEDRFLGRRTVRPRPLPKPEGIELTTESRAERAVHHRIPYRPRVPLHLGVRSGADSAEKIN